MLCCVDDGRAVLRAGIGRLAVAAAVAATTALAAAAQQPTFRTGTEVVQLDVSVVDKQGQPVHGLTQQDFAVFEDGKPQSIVAFKAVDLPDTVTPATSTAPASWTKTVARDVSTNQLDHHRLFAIVMDDATIVPDASVIERARDAARSVIDKMGPNDLATVMFTRRDKLTVQDFTNDHAKLLDTVESFSVGYGPLTCSDRQDALGVLRRVAEYLAAAPDQRKALVYVSSSMGIDFARPDTCGVGALARDVFRAAQQANVNIYPIDACGLRTPIGENPCSEGPPYLHVEFLQTVANNTGGQAIVTTNDFEPGIVQMFIASGSYYLIGYAPSNMKADGTFRRIAVKVPRRRDIDVWTRKNYYAPNAKADAKSAAQPQPAGHEKLLAGILPNAAVSLQMTTAPFKRDARSADVAVVLGVTRDATTASASDMLDVVVGAFTPEGTLVASVTQAARFSALIPSQGVLQYEALASLALPPGRYELRAGVHSSALSKDGSVYGDLDVPDFASEHLSLSGVLIDAVPGLVSEPKGAFGTMAPTTQRTFNRGSHVSAFVRIYQGSKDPFAPVTLHTWIYDAHGAATLNQTETVAATGFAATGSVDHRYELPIAGLAPGEYVLTFKADRGKDTYERDVRFTVK
jgi:VWFA-related protein